MNRNDINQKDKYIFYYLRYAMLMGPLTILYFFIYETRSDLSFNLMVVHQIIAFSCVPGYFILPGILRGLKNSKRVNYFEVKLFMVFTAFTLGIGPAILFFTKIEPIMKTMINDKKAT